MGGGIMDTVYPILGYVLAIAVLLILATVGFMALASASVVSAATTMASILIDRSNYLTVVVRDLLGELEKDHLEIQMLPTGDGMVLFLENPDIPIELAIGLAKRLEEYNKSMESGMELELRIGIHAGDTLYSRLSCQTKDVV